MNKDRLYDYLPPYFQQMLDMKEIVDTETIELKELEDNINKINDNFYVDTCDAITLKEQYEDLLGLVANSTDTLDIRRILVKNAWNNFTPYTRQSLKAKLYALFKDNYELLIDYPNQHITVILIQSEEVNQSYKKLVESLLLTMPPTRMTSEVQMGSRIENIYNEYHAYVNTTSKIIDVSFE